MESVLAFFLDQVVASQHLDIIHSAEVQQAFLPKFENEGQDATVAEAIVKQVSEALVFALYLAPPRKHSQTSCIFRLLQEVFGGLFENQCVRPWLEPSAANKYFCIKYGWVRIQVEGFGSTGAAFI